jgi:hypothetical protein
MLCQASITFRKAAFVPNDQVLDAGDRGEVAQGAATLNNRPWKSLRRNCWNGRAEESARSTLPQSRTLVAQKWAETGGKNSEKRCCQTCSHRLFIAESAPVLVLG